MVVSKKPDRVERDQGNENSNKIIKKTRITSKRSAVIRPQSFFGKKFREKSFDKTHYKKFFIAHTAFENVLFSFVFL